MAVLQPRFGTWDYVVLAVVLIISSAIGLYYRFTGGKQKTMKVSNKISIRRLIFYITRFLRKKKKQFAFILDYQKRIFN